MKSFLHIFVTVLALFAPAAALAAEKDAAAAKPAAGAGGDYMCPALQKPESYRGGKKSYRLLVRGKDGWLFRTETDFKEDFALKPEMLDYFKTLGQAFKRKGVDLVLLMPPTRAIVHPSVIPAPGKNGIPAFDTAKATQSYDAFLDSLRKEGMNVASFADILPLDPAKTQFFYRRDHHWTATGAKLSADRVAEIIKALPVYASLPKQKFTTKETGRMVAPDGSFANFIGKVCNVAPPPESVPERVTLPDESAAGNSAQGLFGDAAKAQVALVGTSNGVEGEPSWANFAGFLREDLSADVENLSIGGAGFDAPMISYLNAGKLGQHKVVIWEVATHYNFGTRAMRGMMRELLPPAFGMCGDDQAIAKMSLDSVKQEKMPLFNGLNEKIPGGLEYFVAIRSGEKLKGTVTLSGERIGAKPEFYKFIRDERYPFDGIYFLTMKQARKKPEKSFSIELPKEAVGKSLEARICPLMR